MNYSSYWLHYIVPDAHSICNYTNIVLGIFFRASDDGMSSSTSGICKFCCLKILIEVIKISRAKSGINGYLP